MQPRLNSVQLRYVLAIIATAALMIWQAGDAVRSGGDFRSIAMFWAGAVTIGWLQMVLIARGVRATFGTDQYPGWALLIASALIGAIPLTFQIRWLVETIVAPQAGLPAPWVTYLNVCVINTVFSLIQYLAIERWPLFQTDPTSEQPGVSNTPVASRKEVLIPTIGLLRRRPAGLNGVIQYLQMEDHYLRIQTDEGSDLVLHRMGDAVEDLAETDGKQVHKSWWVSHAIVDEIRNENRKRIVVARDGTIIPIGRSFENSLREAGWF